MDEIHLTLSPEEGIQLGPGDPGVPSRNELDIFETETRRCSITCRATTIQPAARFKHDSPATLLILVFTLHPESNCRFTSLRISCAFKNLVGNDQTAKSRALLIAPIESHGGHSEVDKSWTFGLSAPISVPGGVFSITPSVDHTVARKVDHYLVIKGSRRGTPPTSCIWTMNENDGSKTGLPLSFTTAIILQTNDTVGLELKLKSTVVWRGFPRTLTAGTELVKITLSTPMGRQFPVKQDLDELKLESWFTGGLEGSVHKWPFDVVHT